MHKIIGLISLDYYILYPNRLQSRPFCAEILVNAARRLLAGSHRQNHGGRTDYGIAARKDTFARGLTGLLIRNQTTFAICLKSLRC